MSSARALSGARGGGGFSDHAAFSPRRGHGLSPMNLLPDNSSGKWKANLGRCGRVLHSWVAKSKGDKNSECKLSFMGGREVTGR